MQSSEPINTRFILIVIGAVALLFGGIVGFALTRDGDSQAKPRQVAVAKVKPAPTSAAGAAPSAIRTETISPTRDVPPAIDTGPLEAAATPRGERVPVADVVSGPWEVVDLESSPGAGTATSKSTAAEPAPKAPVKTAPAKTAKTEKTAKAEKTTKTAKATRPADTEPVPVVVPVVTPRVTIVDSAIATGVTDREPVGANDAFSPDVERIWAWVKVKNDGPPTTVTMVWRKGDEVAFRYTLDIGTSPSWRTWSNKTLRAWDAGDWTVDVLDANGLRVAALRFEVEPASTGDVVSAR